MVPFDTCPFMLERDWSSAVAAASVERRVSKMSAFEDSGSGWGSRTNHCEATPSPG